MTKTFEERCKLAAECLPKAEYRTRLEALHAELLAEIESAIPAMRAYASKNPKHHMGGAEQDPNGAHAWLERNDLPNAGNAP